MTNKADPFGRVAAFTIGALPAISLSGFLASAILMKAYVANEILPCGPKSDCLAVAQDSWAHVHGVPTPALGLVFFGSCFLIALRGILLARGPNRMQITLFVIGFVIAIAFAARDLVHVRAICIWCTAAWIAAAAQLAAAILTYDIRSGRRIGVAIPAALMAVATLVFMWGWSATRTRAQAVLIDGLALETRPLEDLIPSGAPTALSQGHGGTLVAFLDFDCPTCHEIYPDLRKYCSGSNQPSLVVRFVSREEDDIGRMYTAGAFLAKRHGRFFEFADATFKGTAGISALHTLLANAGVSVRESAPLFASLHGPVYAQVDLDQEAVKVFGVRVSPTLILVTDKGERRPVLLSEFSNWVKLSKEK